MNKKVLRFEITDRCNQRCKMCWSVDWKHRDMSFDEIKKLILDYNETYPNGTIVLTSREPLLSPCIKEVLDLTKRLNIEVKLLTNGTLLNDEYCEMIMNSTINFISISIHGDEKTHNEIVNVPNSYKKVLEGLKKICEYKKKYNREDLILRITTVINDNIMNSIDGIIDIAKTYNTELRIQHLMWHNKTMKEKHKSILKDTFNEDDYVIDGFLDETSIEPNKVINFIKETIEKCKKENVDLQIYPDLDDDNIVKWYSNEEIEYKDAYCDHVDTSIRVRANGDVALCQYIESCFGNIKNKDLKDIVETEEYKSIANNLKNGSLFPICYNCCHLRFHKKEIDNKGNKKI